MKSVLLCLSAGFWLHVFCSTKGLFKTSPSVLINCRPGGRRAQWGWRGSRLVSISPAGGVWKHGWFLGLGPHLLGTLSPACCHEGRATGVTGITYLLISLQGAHWGCLEAESTFVLAKEDENPKKHHHLQPSLCQIKARVTLLETDSLFTALKSCDIYLCLLSDLCLSQDFLCAISQCQGLLPGNHSKRGVSQQSHHIKTPPCILPQLWKSDMK